MRNQFAHLSTLPPNIARVSRGALKANDPGDRSAEPASPHPPRGRILYGERSPNRAPDFIENIISDARVLIVEGIPGSGKDTFQAYLKERLKGRNVHDYSEGELLQSWKHFPIDGIRKLRVNFMKLFVNSVRSIIDRDRTAVFLLNRFHLAAYVTTISRQPDLAKEYDKVIDALRTLPVHVFILQLNDSEIDARSAHGERSGVWPMLQQQMVAKDGFRDKFARYSWQQRTILETAERQQIPYSIIRLNDVRRINVKPWRAADPRSRFLPRARIDATIVKLSGGGERLPLPDKKQLKPTVPVELASPRLPQSKKKSLSNDRH